MLIILWLVVSLMILVLISFIPYTPQNNRSPVSIGGSGMRDDEKIWWHMARMGQHKAQLDQLEKDRAYLESCLSFVHIGENH
jgi:uncharacterized membrane protein YqjE